MAKAAAKAKLLKYAKHIGGKMRKKNRGGGGAKMTEATQTTFSRIVFGKEMSENSGLFSIFLHCGFAENENAKKTNFRCYFFG